MLCVDVYDSESVADDEGRLLSFRLKLLSFPLKLLSVPLKLRVRWSRGSNFLTVFMRWSSLPNVETILILGSFGVFLANVF